MVILFAIGYSSNRTEIHRGWKFGTMSESLKFENVLKYHCPVEWIINGHEARQKFLLSRFALANWLLYTSIWRTHLLPFFHVFCAASKSIHLRTHLIAMVLFDAAGSSCLQLCWVIYQYAQTVVGERQSESCLVRLSYQLRTAPFLRWTSEDDRTMP